MPEEKSRGHVFVNCPFDESYDPQFDAIVFAVQRCGFTMRCAREREDAGQTRIDKIMEIIDECQLGIHDISYTRLDPINKLPRFNMPFELGLDLGAKRYGATEHGDKKILILDREPYRFNKFISDINGQDVVSHGGTVEGTVRRVRTFLNSYATSQAADGVPIPSAKNLLEHYERFNADLPDICEAGDLDPDDLDYADFLHVVSVYIAAAD